MTGKFEFKIWLTSVSCSNYQVMQTRLGELAQHMAEFELAYRYLTLFAGAHTHTQ